MSQQSKFDRVIIDRESFDVVIKAGESIILSSDEEIDRMTAILQAAKRSRREAKRAYSQGDSLLKPFNGNGGNGNGNGAHSAHSG